MTYLIGFITCLCYLIMEYEDEKLPWKRQLMIVLISLLWPIYLAAWIKVVAAHINTLPLPPKPSPPGCPEPMGKVKEGVELP